jgi:hypothetical protein
MRIAVYLRFSDDRQSTSGLENHTGFAARLRNATAGRQSS